jgi:hypothetical protein
MSINTIIRLVLGTAGLVVVPAAAFAHTGIGATSGLVHGFVHPFTGIAIQLRRPDAAQERYPLPRDRSMCRVLI